MPKENKHKRGRRADKSEKRKREDGDESEQLSKRHRSAEPAGDGEDAVQHTEHEAGAQATGGTDRPFYGLLEDEEQEYFRHADELLELNNFPSVEERNMFLANVYKEAEGKELKIANSQSCSRLMERLILLSSTAQKKKLFQKFAGEFAHLVQHRFASHCCETLFVQSAPVVTRELAGQEAVAEEEDDEGAVKESMEDLFLATLDELEGQMTFLLTDRFASHTLRVLLIVLSGRPLSKSSTKSLLQSKRKEKIGITGLEKTELSLEQRMVPESFTFAVEKIISDTIATMDTTSVRVLATHPTGNPSLQLLLELELTRPSKSKSEALSSKGSLLRRLLPDEIAEENSESSSFVNGLIYDPIGSRLLETIVAFAPGKLFKQVFKTTFKPRIGALARNETASYVVIKVLERLSKEDLEEAVTSIIPQVADLLSKGRTTVIKTLLERCHARDASSSIESLISAISAAYGSQSSGLLVDMLKLDLDSIPDISEGQGTSEAEAKDQPQQKPKPSPEQVHASLLAQTLLKIPGPSSALIQSSLLALTQSSLSDFTPKALYYLAITTTFSHILQAAYVSAPVSDIPVFHKKLTAPLLPHIPSLALSQAGSHVLDAIFACPWLQTHIKESVAQKLVENEKSLREDFIGRVVWRVWGCEDYRRRRGEWIKGLREAEAAATTKIENSRPATTYEKTKLEKKGAKAEEPSTAGVANGMKKLGLDKGGNGKTGAAGGKTAIQLARERHAAKKKEDAKKDTKKAKKAAKGLRTGGNSEPVGVRGD